MIVDILLSIIIINIIYLIIMLSYSYYKYHSFYIYPRNLQFTITKGFNHFYQENQKRIILIIRVGLFMFPSMIFGMIGVTNRLGLIFTIIYMIGFALVFLFLPKELLMKR